MDLATLVPENWCNLLSDYSNLYRQYQNIHVQKQQYNKKNTFPKQIFSLIRQSHNISDKNISIPSEIRQHYLTYRPTPFSRAKHLEQALGCRSQIYYKYEGSNIAGSHKLNSAIAQAYYCKQAGVEHIVTGTGAGQWGTAIAYACQLFNLKCTVFMVRASLLQKPQRKSLMELFGATLYSSPSPYTVVGQNALAIDPQQAGTLAIATGEAIELAAEILGGKFAVGSGESSVLLHQTVIGNEVLKQMELLDLFPNKVYACIGAGSNFCGISFPLMRYAKTHNKTCEFIGIEPIACPKLTLGEYRIDHNDFSGSTPQSLMYTLGSDFVAPPIHAGGLRYHGTSEFLSALYHQGLVHARAISEKESLAAGLLFAEKEGILPAPESAYAIAGALRDINESLDAENQVLINISGHGLYDLSAYTQFREKELTNETISPEYI